MARWLRERSKKMRKTDSTETTDGKIEVAGDWALSELWDAGYKVVPREKGDRRRRYLGC
jgi:hypothetical protein